MAATITSSATSLEGQLYESAVALQGIESAQNPVINNVDLTYNIEDGTVTVTATLPIALTGSGNAATLTVEPYLP